MFNKIILSACLFSFFGIINANSEYIVAFTQYCARTLTGDTVYCGDSSTCYGCFGSGSFYMAVENNPAYEGIYISKPAGCMDLEWNPNTASPGTSYYCDPMLGWRAQISNTCVKYELVSGGKYCQKTAHCANCEDPGCAYTGCTVYCSAGISGDLTNAGYYLDGDNCYKCPVAENRAGVEYDNFANNAIDTYIDCNYVSPACDSGKTMFFTRNDLLECSYYDYSATLTWGDTKGTFYVPDARNQSTGCRYGD
jgi:hypothetical protein